MKISSIALDMEYSYLNILLDKNTHAVKHLPNIRIFSKIIPFIYSYMEQVDSYNQTVYDILTKEIPLIILAFKKDKKEKRCIITTLIASFFGLAYDEI